MSYHFRATQPHQSGPSLMIFREDARDAWIFFPQGVFGNGRPFFDTGHMSLEETVALTEWLSESKPFPEWEDCIACLMRRL
jgi:hypothetical protein